MGSSINQTTALSLTNKTGASVLRGDVVIIDSNNADSFISASGTVNNETPGVVLDSGISANAKGMIAFGGYIPQVNLVSGSAIGDFFGISTTTKKAIPHATIQSGDFGQVLGAGITPPAILWGGANQNEENGWYDNQYNWTYAGNDGSTGTSYYVGNANNLTGTLYPGLKIEITQGTIKYAFITAVNYVTGTTYLTLYGGTDYTFDTTTITKLRTSTHKAPKGFPLSPIKWTVETRNTSEATQSTPVSLTWYNVGSIRIVIPIGVWNVSYQCAGNFKDTTSTNWITETTLSTANNSESDVDFTAFIRATNTEFQVPLQRWKNLMLDSKTTYYLNHMTFSTDLDQFRIRGDTSPTIIRAVCAYL